MQFRIPKNDSKYQWTQHVIDKMMYYGISESLIKRISRFPDRTEEGIAEGTVAGMKRTPNKKNPQEIWIMYQRVGDKKRIISAWRYPGISPVGKKIPIPDEILLELQNVLE